MNENENEEDMANWHQFYSAVPACASWGFGCGLPSAQSNDRGLVITHILSQRRRGRREEQKNGFNSAFSASLRCEKARSNRISRICGGCVSNELGAVGRPAPAGKKERSGWSPDRASDVFSTEMKHTHLWVITRVITHIPVMQQLRC